MSIAPGTYLRKRREAAGFTMSQVAAALAGMPERVRPLRAKDFELLEGQLLAVEEDDAVLTMPQAALLHRVLHFDLNVYEVLLLRHFCETPGDFPDPQICRVCACTWNDPCVGGLQTCAWTPGDPTLCTTCRDTAALGDITPSMGETT